MDYAVCLFHVAHSFLDDEETDLRAAPQRSEHACVECNDKFPTKKGLENHKRTHTLGECDANAKV